MDHHKAKQLEVTLKDKRFCGLIIKKLLNNGKSAAVFLAEDAMDQKVALKIFDNEMIDRFGHELQEKRIQQEIALKGHDIPNLVKILDG
jgi:serine/threonine-protein kinase RIO1